MNSNQSINQDSNMQADIKKSSDHFVMDAEVHEVEVHEAEVNQDGHQHDVNKTNYANQLTKIDGEEE